MNTMTGKRGRKPVKVDQIAKLERSRQSARECRARKKLRYQYLEELVASREKAVNVLKSEMQPLKKQCKLLDEGIVPVEVKQFAEEMDRKREKAGEDGADLQGPSTSVEQAPVVKSEFWDNGSCDDYTVGNTCAYNDTMDAEYSSTLSQECEKYQDSESF
ncbi:PREDICTED: cAMP-responsive element-binding protein-like 2 [Priapulus caudatus]|uniref:cAMP-responsive element-binding protein-like 2 n=1 Tax=Priapulus caudatus TaxID=37621 RepID=A0ABM1E565_PRICU|nr:PREDICTED: cAMP-responsive element-binding protein-like 2 [Priapulus caudatus]